MMKKMNYPADYAVLSNEEMTYTTGGGAVDDAAGIATTAATVVGAVVLASSYIWGIKQARTWLQQDGNKDGNFFTVMGRATDAIAADMGKSAGNFVRDAVSTTMVVALAPLERRSADRALVLFNQIKRCVFGCTVLDSFVSKGVLLWKNDDARVLQCTVH